MEPEIHQHWPSFDEISSLFMESDEYSSDNISCMSNLFSGDYSLQFTGFENELLQLPEILDEFSLENLIENCEPNLIEPFDNNIYESDEQMSSDKEEEEEELWSPTPSTKSSVEITKFPLPDHNLGVIHHLLKACGAAIENDQRDLASVILKRVSEKVSPVGEAIERVAFNLSGDGDYMKQESRKNFPEAFRGIYELFPDGRFAHFASNSTILDAIPIDAEIIHLVDFDVGEAIQWPGLIESLALQRQIVSVKLTAIKWGEDYNCHFEETKRRLCDHARSFGLKLEMKEMTIDELMSDAKRMKKRRREFFAFNCQVSLPHMGRERSRNLVSEFLQMAKDLLANFQGVLTFGDGDACETTAKDCPSFGAFFERRLVHYQALLESMESNFPTHLAEARMAIESLFVAPYISTRAWVQKWTDINDGIGFPATTAGLEGWRLNRGSLMEAKALVRDGVSLYGVRIGGSENKMVLEWKQTPLVMVSAWRSQS